MWNCLNCNDKVSKLYSWSYCNLICPICFTEAAQQTRGKKTFIGFSKIPSSRSQRQTSGQSLPTLVFGDCWAETICCAFWLGRTFWLLSTAEPCGGTAECRPSLTRIWNDITQLLVLPDTSRLSSFGGFQFSKGGRDPEFETKSLIWTFYETSQCWRKDLL